MKVIVRVFMVLLMVIPSLASATDTRIGVVKNVRGYAFIERDTKRISIKVGDRLFEKDVIVTKNASSLGLILRDNSLLSIGSNSRVILSEFRFEPAGKKLSSLTRIKKGTLTYLTGLMAKMNPNAVKFETPSAVCGVRGTHFAIKVEED